MPVSAASSLVVPSTTNNLRRRSANYRPDIWGNHFIQYLSEPMNGTSKFFNVQELDEIMKQIIMLKEKLLRQQGYHILPGVFEKFKNEQGNFKETLVDDVEGMLSLYESTHMRIHGEDILDEAFSFTSSHLEIMTTQLSPSLATKVSHSLKRPLFKNLPRLVARNYISTYEEDPSHDETLLLLAKLDFNLLQKRHQKELGDISKWWKELDFATKLPFARNRIVEGYFWILGVYFEYQYSVGRKIMTKVIAMASVIDDIYDNYGTLEELQLFTQAIKREEAINELSRQVTYAWKDINEELLDATDIPKPLLTRVLNLARVIYVLYKDEDCYTNSQGSTKNDIISILMNPCPI
ncbi:hypothetical protein RYX36_035843 [Vicia faba]